jgi:hypothetical protein
MAGLSGIKPRDTEINVSLAIEADTSFSSSTADKKRHIRPQEAWHPPRKI